MIKPNEGRKNQKPIKAENERMSLVREYKSPRGQDQETKPGSTGFSMVGCLRRREGSKTINIED